MFIYIANDKLSHSKTQCSLTSGIYYLSRITVDVFIYIANDKLSHSKTQRSLTSDIYYLSRIISDNDLVAILLEVMYLWCTKHIDNSYRERLHKCLGDISIIIQQSLESLSQSLQYTHSITLSLWRTPSLWYTASRQMITVMDSNRVAMKCTVVKLFCDSVCFKWASCRNCCISIIYRLLQQTNSIKALENDIIHTVIDASVCCLPRDNFVVKYY